MISRFEVGSLYRIANIVYTCKGQVHWFDNHSLWGVCWIPARAQRNKQSKIGVPEKPQTPKTTRNRNLT
jgi:hypothetical protein